MGPVARSTFALAVLLLAGCALFESKRATYPKQWVVPAPKASSELAAITDLATTKFAGYRIERVEFSSDWKTLRHRRGSQVVGRAAGVLVTLHDAAKERCLLAEVEAYQERLEGPDAWSRTSLRGDLLKDRSSREVPTVARIGPRKEWWTIPLAACPAP